MNDVNPTRRSRLWLSVALVSLALCLVGWGLEYKLSLYAAPQSASRLIPQAKLLSRNERTDDKTVSFMDDSVTPPAAGRGTLLSFPMLLVAIPVLAPHVLGLQDVAATGCSDLQQLSYRNHSLSRPPPRQG